MNEIIINKEGENIAIYVIENNEICERYIHSNKSNEILGNIYIGTVTQIIDGMQAAFVNIGTKRNAFIPVKDILPKVDIVKEQNVSHEKISNILKIGDHLLVQVRKEEEHEKGPRVSTHLTLPGNYIVLMPDTDIVTISQKIEDETEKNRLLSIVKENLPKDCGIIVRTDAEGIEKEKIISDIEGQINKWEEILKKSAKCNETMLIYDDHNIAYKVARDMVNKNTKKVYINDEQIYKDMLVNMKDMFKAGIEYFENENIIKKFGLETEVSKIDNNRIWLKCGGYIVIDKTEALTAIDVNSGKCVGEKNLEYTALKVNLEAATEIMKQIRLKDIGGIVVIDYIDMKEKDNEEKVLEMMRNEGKRDRSKLDIKDFTKLHLVEMTRKKMSGE